MNDQRTIDSLNNALTTTSQANANLSAKVSAMEENLDACASECLGLRATVNDQHRIIMNLESKGHRLALELECLLNDTKDTAIQSKWWDSAHEALEEWRK